MNDGSEEKRRILFVCGDGSFLGPMARGIFSRRAGDSWELESASLLGQAPSKRAVQEMFRRGVDISRATSYPVEKLSPGERDVVVTLDGRSREAFLDATVFHGDKSWPYLGYPVHMHWEVEGARPGEDPLGSSWTERPLDEETVKAAAGWLWNRVEGVWETGVFEVALRERVRWRNLLDFLDVGVMAHDARRRIFLLNDEAARILGVRREEILGRDCYEVFAPSGLCGARCILREGRGASVLKRRYPRKIESRGGEVLRLRLGTAPMGRHMGQALGTLVSIHDETELTRLRTPGPPVSRLHGMAGRSEAMQRVFQTIKQVAASDYPVLITGESGTGKELAARAVHLESSRRDGAFVPVNCGALPENILESELFGHVRGAFTGAIRDKKGRFELAHGGTLFLDEVGELSPPFQVKLLRVLQEGHFVPVGGERMVEVDVRVVSATNKSLKDLMNAGTFREDLYYRLAVVPLELPPLRERREDIPVIVEHVLERIRRESETPHLEITDSATAAILDYGWPGNVRELINALQFASVRSEDGALQAGHLPPEVQAGGVGGGAGRLSHAPFGVAGGAPWWQGSSQFVEEPKARPLQRKRGRPAALQFDQVQEALERADGNRSQAARLLGVSRATLYRFLSKHPSL